MIKTPLFPTYKEVRFLLIALENEREETYRSLDGKIMNLTGTPQNPISWDNPDQWIVERLSGEEQRLALKIWRTSSSVLNPRHLRGSYYLSKNFDLFNIQSGSFLISDKGKEFISSEPKAVEEKIDEDEGLIEILTLISLNPGFPRKEYIHEWREYLYANSNYKEENVVKTSFSERANNLIDRGLLVRSSHCYSITPEGEAYLATAQAGKSSRYTEEQKLVSEVEEFKKLQKRELKTFLSNMQPYRFEHLIKDLLESMGYENVVVTQQSNDKGVDVIGNIEIGITNVKEVIQVKRNTTSNINRDILDKLRGSLHRFQAIKGTIICLSDFAKGAKNAAYEQGAAPITLINGERLVDLIIENEILIKRKSIDYYTFDENYFSNDDDNNNT
jgi:restriction system protein